MSRWADRLLATALALLLAGCATVPTTGPVQRHTPEQPEVNAGIVVAPVPPPVGASPMLVVEGFLHAMATYQPGYQIARAYLTDAASQRWRPESGVRVYADGYPPTEVEDTVVLVAPVIGGLDARGTFQASGGQLRHDFGLVKDSEGEWRISRAPDGLLVSRYLFESGFTPTSLHYFDNTGSVLVPDSRYFPVGEHTLRAALEGQLAGPSGWLEPAVISSDTASIALQSVTVDQQGIADITLGPAADALDEVARSQLLAEIVHTATGVEGVVGVRVKSGTGLWTLPPDSDPILSAAEFSDVAPVDPEAPSELFVVTDGRLQRLSPAAQGIEFVPMAPALDPAESVSVRADVAQVAAVIDGGRRLQTSPVAIGDAQVVYTATSIVRPHYARNGELWASTAADARDVQVIVDGIARPVITEAIPAGRLLAFRLSSDGSRVAMVLERRGSAVVGLAIIVRVDGQTRLEAWRPVSLATAGGAVGEVVDVGWSAATELLVLVSGAGGATSVIRVDQDSAKLSDVGPNEAADLVELAVTPGRPAMVRAGSGAVYRYNGDFDWGLSMTEVDALTYSG